MYHPLNRLSNVARSKGDPKLLRSGPSPLTSADRLARSLGWFSIGLGAIELIAPHRLTRALGMRDKETLVRAYGLREILSGVMSLSVDRQTGLRSRLAGDGLDVMTLLPGLRSDNPRRGTVALALLMVGGIAMLDLMGAQDLAAQSSPTRGRRRLYHDRSGFPKGIAFARGAAKRLSESAAAPVS